jgi:hypothetical protein
MSPDHRLCDRPECSTELRPDQKRYCSRTCVREAYKANASSAGAIHWHRRELQPHGTGAAWRRHYRRGEPPCSTCRRWRAEEDTTRRSLSTRSAS